MNNISVARETIRIIERGSYTVGGKTVSLPDMNYSQVIVMTPEQGAALVDAFQPRFGSMCSISVTAEDTFSAAQTMGGVPLVLNFANGHHAGGGFLFGANAQEEALCRCSTLYASISSETAKEMYRYNNTHLSAVESDYMLLSPSVCVFRDYRSEMLEQPFPAAVITAPAPNRRGAAAFANKQTIRETFQRRIRIILAAAAQYGYRDAVLGAWGCGAFGNDPAAVAADFRQVIVQEHFGSAFDRIRFAVCGNPNGRNIRAFLDEFAKETAKTV